MMANPMRTLLAILMLLPAFGATAMAQSNDWPAWMGAQRDGVYHDTDIIESIPESGLEVKWRMPIAAGYAGPAVADGRVFVFDYVKSSGEIVNNPGSRAELQGSERLTAFDETTGEQLWQHEYDCPYSISYPSGPRCTPTIDGEFVYLLGSEGDLRCLSVADGKKVWSVSFKTDLNAEVPIWGFAAHPLIDGDLLYTMVGGEGQAVVAFDKRTGDVKWKAINSAAGYCPPTIIEHGGQRQLIVYHPLAVESVDPATGAQNWSMPIKPSYDMSIAFPYLEGDRMYASGIQNASVMMELSAENEVTELWRGKPKSALFSANATPLMVDGVIYGADCNEGCLVAVDAADGSRLWKTFEATVPTETRLVKHGTAFITRIGATDRYLVMSEQGDLLMARMNRDGWQSLGKFHAVEPTGECFGRKVVWSHPGVREQDGIHSQ